MDSYDRLMLLGTSIRLLVSSFVSSLVLVIIGYEVINFCFNFWKLTLIITILILLIKFAKRGIIALIEEIYKLKRPGSLGVYIINGVTATVFASAFLLYINNNITNTLTAVDSFIIIGCYVICSIVVSSVQSGPPLG